MGEVISLHKKEPHIVVETELMAHVVPVEFFEDFINGEATFNNDLFLQDLLRGIIKDWLANVAKKESI